GAVTRVHLGARGAPVVEVAERQQALVDDVAARPAVHVDDEGDAAGVVFVGGVVEALPGGEPAHASLPSDGCRGYRDVAGPCGSGNSTGPGSSARNADTVRPMPAPPLSLVVLAAGMARRFGGLKQVTPVGPEGEALVDLTVADAATAGVEQVVAVVRPEIRAEVGA